MALKNKKIKVKVELHSSTSDFYCIYYKEDKWWKEWRQLVGVWDGLYLEYDQTVLFSNFDEAVEYAKKLKENPELIDKHYEKQDKIYEESLRKRNEKWKRKNKSIIL